MKSIKWKLVLINLALVLLIMLISGTFIIVRIKNIEVQSRKEELTESSIKIANEIISKYDEKDFQTQLQNQYSFYSSSSSKIQVNILNSKGETIATTATVSKPYPIYKNSDVIKALAGDSSFSYGRQDKDATGIYTQWMNLTTNISKTDGKSYIVFLRMDIRTMNNSLNKTIQTILISLILAIFVGCIMAYIFANTLTGPIADLTKSAKLLARGHLNEVIQVRSNDEIGQLTENFNYMAKELQNTMTTISSEKNKLEAVLHNMTDGILAYDKQGIIIHANPAASEMLQLSEIPVNMESLIEKFSLEESVEHLTNIEEIKEEIVSEHIIDVKGKYININMVPYFSKENMAEGVIVILQDITKQKKLDDMRKEFVANVSHELRTPLTTVKSYSETLLDGALEDQEITKEFLQIIDSEADRMALLVSDLLQLSRFDNNQYELHKSPVVVDEFLESCFNQHKILAEKKNQKYTYTHLDVDVEFNIDADRISQVLSNIIGNAIKYSPENATISVFSSLTDSQVKVYIKDNGFGIPDEDLPRIFERFYRVDKARSRAMGGTGLGLSISKEIVQLHNGSIVAKSKYGEGTTMIISLPRM